MILHEEMGEELLTAHTAVETTYEPDYEAERNKPMPNFIHGAIQSALVAALRSADGNQYIFPTEVTLDTFPPTTPDVLFFPKRKLDIKTITAREKEVPITTVEILSPSQSVNELMHKAWDIYFPIGVQSVWIVIPEFKAIQVVLPNDENHYFDAGLLTDPATGIQISVAAVFEDLV